MATIKVKLETPIEWDGKPRKKGELIDVSEEVASLNQSIMTVVEEKPEPEEEKDK